MINEDEVSLKENPEDTRYIKMRPKAARVWAKDLIPKLCHYRELQTWEQAGS